jgi:glycosyltransferase involved in cell wall biosynthesis
MVTVLMSVYNTPADLLDQAIRSVLQQTYADFEFLILDDGSEHLETREWITDARICWRREPHRGLTATLNLGLALARGEFIARQDADDWSEPQRLERQIEFFKEHPGIALLGSAAWTHQFDGTPLWPVRMPETHAEILDAFPRRNPFVHGSVMFRAAAARDAGGYRQDLACAQDYDFFWRLAETNGAANLAEPLYHYRYTPFSVSSRHAAEQARVMQTVRQHVEWLPEDALRAALKQADHLMLAGDYPAAARAYGSLVRSHPRSAVAWAKLARLGIFRFAPPLRELCFR